MTRTIALALLLALGTDAEAATPAELRQQVRAWRDGPREGDRGRAGGPAGPAQRRHRRAPTSSATPTTCMRMLERARLRGRGCSTAGGPPPAVYGELPVPGARRARWSSTPTTTASRSIPRTGRLRPWKPVLRAGPLATGAREVALHPRRPLDPEWRLYARSASDDKAPDRGHPGRPRRPARRRSRPSVNLKFFLEGEEEAGSPHLTEHPRSSTGTARRPTSGCSATGRSTRPGGCRSVFGARGVMGLEITVYGPVRALHSGHYGNWAPNPAVTLAHLVAGLRDHDGAHPDRRLLRRRAAARSEAEKAAAGGHAPPWRTSCGRSWPGGRTEAEPSAWLWSGSCARRSTCAGSLGPGGRDGGQRHPHRGHGLHRLPPGARPDAREGRASASRPTCARQGCHVVHEAPDLETRRAASPRSCGSTGAPAIRRPARPWTCRSPGRWRRRSRRRSGGPGDPGAHAGRQRAHVRVRGRAQAPGDRRCPS